ncbi:hypothetical protein [Azonexus sp.]|uniref:hypothetical protein n=1 Tax=Azonexus sp. TaxID=1872668 RepID=UPI0035B04F4B
MSYAVVRESRGVLVRWSGPISGKAFLRSVHEINALPDFQLLRYVINDASGCPGIDLPGWIVEDAVAGAIGAHAANRKFVAAFVADQPAVAEAWATIARVANDYLPVAAFGDLATARDWLAHLTRDGQPAAAASGTGFARRTP